MMQATIDSSTINTELNRLQDKSKNLPTQEIGEQLLEDVDNRFAAHSWPDKKDGTTATLIRTGALKEASAIKATNTSVELENPLEYAGPIEFGTQHMPARPFMPMELSSDQEKQLSEIITDHFGLK